MKAAVYTTYGLPNVLHIEEVPKPTPKDNEVLIRIAATTVTSVDGTFRRGDSFFARLFTGVKKPKNPVLGGELSGTVEETGKEVTDFSTGDKVFGPTDEGFGAHAEYICLPEGGPIALIPENLSLEEAAAISYGSLTALPFLRDTGSITSDKKILIIGASGSVGTFAVQLGRHFGAEVTGVCSTGNMDLVKSLGADKVIDYTATNFTTTGKTYDVIFDTVGKSSFSACRKSLTQKGIYMTTVLSMSILLQMLWTSVIGSKKAAIAFTGLRPPVEKRKDLLFIKELIETGHLKPVIDRRYTLEQIAEAHTYVDKGHKKGNLLITVTAAHTN